MTQDEYSIYAMLLERPGQMFITPDGTALYTLVDGMMHKWTGPHFGFMTDEEINLFIQNTVTAALN
jgi:hypothetical protein